MQTRISNAIIPVVEDLLTPGNVLLVAIDARLDYYSEDQKYEPKGVLRGVHIAISKPSNYKKVVMAVDNKNIAFRFDPSLDFKFQSDHDSCWRSDGLQSPLWEISRGMVEEITKNGAPDLPWKEYSWFCHISHFKIVPGEIKIDRNNDYKVTLILKEEKK